MRTPPCLSLHDVVGHKHRESDTPSTARFYVMNSVVLFLILHIFKDLKIPILQKRKLSKNVSI